MNGITIGGSNAPGTANGGNSYLNAFLTAGGGAYCDIIAFHGYPSDSPTYSPVTYGNLLTSFISMIAGKGAGGKPLWNTEFSTLHTVANDETYLARTTFVDLSAGVDRKYYYSYDNGDRLWGPPTTGVPGVLNAAGVAYQTLVGWLTGAVLTSSISTSGVVQSINLIESNGTIAQAVWTSDGSTPSYPVPSGATQYRTLAGGTVTGLGATVTIGANPILFEH